jgi:hypothetical protein
LCPAVDLDIVEEETVKLALWNPSSEVQEEGIVLSTASGSKLQRLTQVYPRCFYEHVAVVEHEIVWLKFWNILKENCFGTLCGISATNKALLLIFGLLSHRASV